MRERIDGVRTRQRILKAACAVFAEKGFHEATVADICKRADTNTASVNYHFNDKESLYVAVWKHLAAEAVRLHPHDGGVPGDAAAAERLDGHIRALVRRMSDGGRLGCFHRLHLMEMVNPTGLIDEVKRELRGPLRQHLMGSIRELLGPGATEKQVMSCEMSVIGQCRSALHGPWRAGRKTQHGSLTKPEIETLADHITRFSLAGIREIRRHIEEHHVGIPK